MSGRGSNERSLVHVAPLSDLGRGTLHEHSGCSQTIKHIRTFISHIYFWKSSMDILECAWSTRLCLATAAFFRFIVFGGTELLSSCLRFKRICRIFELSALQKYAYSRKRHRCNVICKTTIMCNKYDEI